jgi:hypothetical protein
MGYLSMFRGTERASNQAPGPELNNSNALPVAPTCPKTRNE